MSRRLLLPLLALLVTVSGLLAYAAWNRSETRQRLTLTERELNLPWQWVNDTADDDGELRLSVAWQRRGSALDERAWLTDDKLRDLGFDVFVPVGAPEAERLYARALPIIGWAVFEYDGPAWQEIERRREVTANRSEPRPALAPSRLVPIDAGRDRDALTRRHPEANILILPAIFQLGWLSPESGGPLLYGFVQRLVVNQLAIPRRLRDTLTPFRAASRTVADTPTAAEAPRFEVDLAVGKGGYPWVIGVRRTP